VLSSRNVDYTCHCDVLLSKIFLSKSISFLDVEKLPEENITSVTSGYETHIVIEPINSSDFLNMTFALEIRRVFIRIKVEYISAISSVSSSEKMTTITESDFRASLNLDILEEMKLFGKNIHQLNLILDSNNNMETTWMEGYSQSILRYCLRDF
jgi:hypothetical protein